MDGAVIFRKLLQLVPWIEHGCASVCSGAQKCRLAAVSTGCNEWPLLVIELRLLEATRASDSVDEGKV